MSKVYLEDSTLTGIANAIRAKTGESGTITPANMATEIESISGGGGGVDINWSNLDNISCLNKYGVFSDYIPKNITYTGSKLPVSAGLPIDCKLTINRSDAMAVDLMDIPEIRSISGGENTGGSLPPFSGTFIDFSANSGTAKSTDLLGYIDGANWSSSLPTFVTNSIQPINRRYSIWHSKNQVYEGEAPSQNIINTIQLLVTKLPKLKSLYYGNMPPVDIFGSEDGTKTFYGSCPIFFNKNIRFKDVSSLIPIIKTDSVINSQYNYITSFYVAVTVSNLFWASYYVERLNGLPVMTGSTSNNLFRIQGKGAAYSYIISNMPNLKSFTFELDSNNQPLTANWTNQTIYFCAVSDPYYRPYNHDSAVETINSLPDTSAYVTAQGGTNTIQFTSRLGENTPAGTVNTLTAEEIAVATAKGWTVALN